MHHMQAKAVVLAMAAMTGAEFKTAKPIEPKQFIDNEMDLATKVKKPINGRQKKERARKLRRKG